MIQKSFFLLVLTTFSIFKLLAGNQLREADDSVTVFEPIDGQYASMRIPALAVSKKGTLLAFAAGRIKNGGDWSDMDLLLRRSENKGLSWGPVQVIAKRKGDQPTDNPTIIVGQDGTLHLVYQRNYAKAYYMQSKDDGLTWSKPMDITSVFESFTPEYDWKVLAPGPGHSIQLKSGRLIIPVWLAASAILSPKRSHYPSRVATIYSDDQGHTWKRGALIPDVPGFKNPSETMAVELADGRVMLSIRNAADRKRRGVSYSADGVSGWTAPEFMEDLFDPTCMASILRLSGKKYENTLLFVNPDSKEIAGHPRVNLTVKASTDGGKSWPLHKVINKGPSGYADLAEGPDGSIYCLFETKNPAGNKGLSLVLKRFDMDWLLSGDPGLLSASQVQYQTPVLTFKENNPVFRIHIRVPDDGQEHWLQGLTLHMAGTTDPQDIKAVRVYAYGPDSTAGTMRQISHPLFGQLAAPAGEALISGSQVLSPGDNFFWVAYELRPDADLTHLVDGECTQVQVDAGKLPVSGQGNLIRQRVGVALRQAGQDGVHTSRIPGLATTNNGTLLAIFDARRELARDLQGDIDIGLHRSIDGGQRWEPIRIAMDQGEWGGLPQKFNGVSDPCILVDSKSNTIYIAALWMYGVLDEQGKWTEGLRKDSKNWNHQWHQKGSQPGFGVKETSQFLLVKSTDDGKTWSKPVNLTRMCKKEGWWLWAPAPGRGIAMEDGTLVFPTQGRDERGRAFSNVTYSRDRGRTWKTSNPAVLRPKGTTECAVAELSDHSLMLNMRANGNRGNLGDHNGRAVAVTQDLGKTWRAHPSSFNALPEPTCMASLWMHKFYADGKKTQVLVFSNPHSKTDRDSMTIQISTDDGISWPQEFWVLLDEQKSRGYSCLTSVDEDHIGILYESSQADLVFQKIKIDKNIIRVASN